MTAAERKAKKFRFTPDQIKDELTDRIEQGFSNDQIVAMHPDVGPNLRRWLTSQRSRIRKFWESMG